MPTTALARRPRPPVRRPAFDQFPALARRGPCERCRCEFIDGQILPSPSSDTFTR